MYQTHFEVRGQNRFDFNIVAVGKEWFYQGYEIIVRDGRVWLKGPKLKEGTAYKVNQGHLYERLFNMYEEPTAGEIQKITLSEIRTAANVNPEFARQIYLDIFWDLKAANKDTKSLSLS